MFLVTNASGTQRQSYRSLRDGALLVTAPQAFHAGLPSLGPSGTVRRGQVHSLIMFPAPPALFPCRSEIQHFRNWNTRPRILVLFTQGLGVRFAVGIEEFLSALLPRRFEFGRRDVPVRTAFLGDCS
jgi:hypothetical protein